MYVTADYVLSQQCAPRYKHRHRSLSNRLKLYTSPNCFIFSYQQYPCNSIHATNPLLPSNSFISSSGQVSRQPCLGSLGAVVC
ncbi:hypothetical protein DPMN_189030 [Dreissena polymorpha]|uniref:Uncharacterized protein n=1 Tax=Dreissena polymorpha TaxID=45954 RepID=A0A9D4DSE8_DREPO|nr:hypothetical protein DPMN_189030 [Dreissena polymorpha]